MRKEEAGERRDLECFRSVETSELTRRTNTSLSSSSALEPDLDFLAGTVALTGAGVLSATTPAGVSRGIIVQS